MKLATSLIRTATENDWKRLAELIHFSTQLHRHLEWREPLGWLGSQPYLVAEMGNHLLAVLACPPDPPEISWIRLFGVDSSMTVEEGWQALWPTACQWLVEHGVRRVAAIATNHWFSDLLLSNGFEHTNDIITLIWDCGVAQNPPVKQPACSIRNMIFEDLQAVFEVDRAAFGLEWQNSYEALKLAFSQSALATVAEQGQRVLAYQISTTSPLGAHLARLAVRPELQGNGIGYVLVYDLLREFQRRGVNRVSVNTQSDNLASRRLYQRAGFCEMGEAHQVYQIYL